MSIALVQKTVATGFSSGGSANKTITLPSPPTNGNALRLQVNYIVNSSQTLTSISGGGVTWSEIGTTDSGPSVGVAIEIWAGENVAVSPTGVITLTFSSAYTSGVGVVSEWSGMPTTTTTSGTPINNDGRSATPSTGSITPTGGTPALLLANSATTGTMTAAAGSSFTDMGFGGIYGFGYRIIASPSGSYSTSWTDTPSYSSWGTTIAGFAGASGGGASPIPQTDMEGGMNSGMFQPKGMNGGFQD